MSVVKNKTIIGLKSLHETDDLHIISVKNKTIIGLKSVQEIKILLEIMIVKNKTIIGLKCCNFSSEIPVYQS